MKSRKVASVLAFGWLLFWANGGWAEVLVIPGTGACGPALRRVAAAFEAAHPGDRVEVPPSVGSGGGIRAVLGGKAVLARVARPLRGDERAEGLAHLPFARDSVVFATGRGVGLGGLTSQELEGIFSGRITRWNELGGPDRAVRVFVREPGDASLMQIASRLPWFASPRFSPKSRMLYHDYEMVQMLTKYPTGIGFLTGSTLADRGDVTRTLELDGIAPSVPNLADGTYPLAITYAIVRTGGPLTPLPRRFLEYLRSPEGFRALRQAGVAPVHTR